MASTKLTANELLDVVMAVLNMKHFGRSVAYSQFTLDDIRREALLALGESELVQTDTEGQPLGQIQRIKSLRDRLEALLENAKKRANK